MKLMIYMPAASEKGRRLLDGVRLLPPETIIEVFDTRAAFLRQLRQPKEDSLIVILFDPIHEDLEAVKSARELLVNIHLLLVLSEQEPLTMTLAYRLLPSFITYVDSDLSQLLSVIRKLLPVHQEARKA